MKIVTINTDQKIYFNFTNLALELLGKNLYSNVWSALSELIANGIDAKATKIKVLLDMRDKENSIIEIFDNGTGMSYADLAEKYTFLGRNKRNSEEYDSSEMSMGRKGIGKLAALYLSKKYYIVTKNKTITTWMLDISNAKADDLPCLEKIQNGDIKLQYDRYWENENTGTLLKLTKVDLTNIGIKTIEGFKARLAEFYQTNSINCEISVCIVDEKTKKFDFVPIKKSIAYKNIYALFDNSNQNISTKIKHAVYAKSDTPSISKKMRDTQILNIASYPNIKGKKQFVKTDGTLSKPLDYELKGWIGIHTAIDKDSAKRNDDLFIKNVAYKPNALRLYIRNKLAVSNFLTYLKNNQVFSNYIEGEISFDILDHDELPDITTSNRQDLHEEDERVKLLIDILKPIVNTLITKRLKLSEEIKKEEKEFREKQEREKEEARKRAEALASQLQDQNKGLINTLRKKEKDLSSEKKRNSFLNQAVTLKQKDYIERMHMFQINLGTVSNIINKWIIKKNRNTLTVDYMWDGVKMISYTTEKMKGNLKYGGLEDFNTQDEYISGDLFKFIDEFCKITYGKYNNLNVYSSIYDNAKFETSFSPQDIAVIICNIVSNSEKHNSKNLYFEMYKKDNFYCIDAINDGKKFDFSTVKDKNELFGFGKGFTFSGSGVGLYHIHKIITEKMNAHIDINETTAKGFELQMRFEDGRFKDTMDR